MRALLLPQITDWRERQSEREMKTDNSGGSEEESVEPSRGVETSGSRLMTERVRTARGRQGLRSADPRAALFCLQPSTCSMFFLLPHPAPSARTHFALELCSHNHHALRKATPYGVVAWITSILVTPDRTHTQYIPGLAHFDLLKRHCQTTANVSLIAFQRGVSAQMANA